MAADMNNLNENEITSEQSATDQAVGSAGAAVMAERDIQTVTKAQTVRKVFVNIGLYAFLGFMALVVIFPFYWMLLTSVKTITEYKYYNPTFWPTEGFRFETYKIAFETVDFGNVFLNTVLVGVVSTILSLIVTVLSAFALSRLEFKGKSIVFGAMLATMMIPGELFTVTNYITISRFNWTDSYVVLIVPFLVSVFYIYLLRQNFLQIPNELYLAAKVDGTSDFKYLWKVMIPLAAPTLISITILKMMGSWNSYVWPHLVNTDKSYWIMTQALRDAYWGEGNNIDYPAQMAAVVLVTIPLLIVFLLFRKYIIRGVSRGGTKG